MRRASKFSFHHPSGLSRRTVAARHASGNAAAALGRSVALEAGCGLCGCMFRSKGIRGDLMKTLVNGLAVLLTCCVVAVSADLFRRAGLSLYTEQYLAGLLALALPLIYLHVPAGTGRTRVGPVPWFDILAAIVAFFCSVYVVFRFPPLSELVSERPWDGLLVAALMVLLVLEGLRRTTGNALVYTTIGFFVLALIAGYLPGEFAAKSIPLDRLTYYVLWDSTAILGVPMK